MTQSSDFSAIFLNLQQIQGVLHNAERRRDRFEKQFVLQHKNNGNSLFKFRHGQYNAHLRVNAYKTPYLMMRDKHRGLAGKLTKAEKNRDREKLDHRFGNPKTGEINYIKAYPDQKVPIKGRVLTETLRDMMAKSELLIEDIDKKFTMKDLAKFIAQTKIERMDFEDIQSAMELARQGEIQETQNKATKQMSPSKKLVYRESKRDLNSMVYGKKDNFRRLSLIKSKRQSNMSTINKDWGKDNAEDFSHEAQKATGNTSILPQKEQKKRVFSIEEVFRMALIPQIRANMNILAAKKQEALAKRVECLISGDVDDIGTNQKFRQSMKEDDPESLLEDITYQIVNKVIKSNIQKKKDAENNPSQKASARSLSSTTARDRENNTHRSRTSKQSQRRTAKSVNQQQPSRIDLETIAAWQQTGKDGTQFEFNPRIGVDLDPQKHGPNSKRMKFVFNSLTYALKNMDKELYKKFRSGRLSLAQVISRIERDRPGGIKFKVLDDFIDEDSDKEDLLKKPDPAVLRAFHEEQEEQRLFAEAKKRGVDIEVLKKTAPNFNLEEKCMKSVYFKKTNKEKELEKADHDLKFKLQEAQRDKVRKLKAQNEEEKRSKAILNLLEKEQKYQKAVQDVKDRDVRNRMKESRTRQVSRQKIDARCDYNLPESFQRRAVEMFGDAFDEEQKNRRRELAQMNRENNLKFKEAINRINETKTREKLKRAEKQDQGHVNEDLYKYMLAMIEDEKEARVVVPDSLRDEAVLRGVEIPIENQTQYARMQKMLQEAIKLRESDSLDPGFKVKIEHGSSQNDSYQKAIESKESQRPHSSGNLYSNPLNQTNQVKTRVFKQESSEQIEESSDQQTLNLPRSRKHNDTLTSFQRQSIDQSITSFKSNKQKRFIQTAKLGAQKEPKVERYHMSSAVQRNPIEGPQMLLPLDQPEIMSPEIVSTSKFAKIPNSVTQSQHVVSSKNVNQHRRATSADLAQSQAQKIDSQPESQDQDKEKQLEKQDVQEDSEVVQQVIDASFTVGGLQLIDSGPTTGNRNQQFKRADHNRVISSFIDQQIFDSQKLSTAEIPLASQGEKSAKSGGKRVQRRRDVRSAVGRTSSQIINDSILRGTTQLELGGDDDDGGTRIENSMNKESEMACVKVRSGQKTEFNTTGLQKTNLVIGGLCKGATSALGLRGSNLKAMQKEYHKRHTRHIRGGVQKSSTNYINRMSSRNPRSDNNYARASSALNYRSNFGSTQSTLQHFNATNAETANNLHQKVSKTNSKRQVPNTVLEWYTNNIVQQNQNDRFNKESPSPPLLGLSSTDQLSNVDLLMTKQTNLQQTSQGVIFGRETQQFDSELMKSPEMPLSSAAHSSHQNHKQAAQQFGLRKASLGESQSELALNAQKIKPASKEKQLGGDSAKFANKKFNHRGRTFSSLLGGNIRKSHGLDSALLRQSALETAKDSQQNETGGALGAAEFADSNVKQSITSMETGFNWLTGAKMSQITNNAGDYHKNSSIDQQQFKNVYREPRVMRFSQSVLEDNNAQSTQLHQRDKENLNNKNTNNQSRFAKKESALSNKNDSKPSQTRKNSKELNKDMECLEMQPIQQNQHRLKLTKAVMQALETEFADQGGFGAGKVITLQSNGNTPGGGGILDTQLKKDADNLPYRYMQIYQQTQEIIEKN